MKSMGVVEIGKLRFADKIEDKGFRRCSYCKTIKPLTEFRKNKGQKNGISNNCYECTHELHHQFIMKQKEEIGDHYVKQYCLRNYNQLPKTPTPHTCTHTYTHIHTQTHAHERRMLLDQIWNQIWNQI